MARIRWRYAPEAGQGESMERRYFCALNLNPYGLGVAAVDSPG